MNFDKYIQFKIIFYLADILLVSNDKRWYFYVSNLHESVVHNIIFERRKAERNFNSHESWWMS